MDENDYKVVRMLDEVLPKAAKPQASGVSFDLRLYLREDKNDGTLWASVAFIDPQSGTLIKGDENKLPLDEPGAVGWFFDRIAERGFPMAVALRTTPGFGRESNATPGQD